MSDGGEAKRGLRRSLCKQAEDLETCRKTCELTLHDIFHACQVRKDLEVVLGSPALVHVGISRVAAGSTPRGVPTLSRRNRALAGRVPSSWLLRSWGSVSVSISVSAKGGLPEGCGCWGGGVVLKTIDRAALRQPPWAAYRRSPIPFLSGLTALYDLSQPLYGDDVCKHVRQLILSPAHRNSITAPPICSRPESEGYMLPLMTGP
jgi:hypothetical protein